jgi:hypothetical protein
MAAMRGKAPVGSAQWLLSERKQVNDLVDQDVEDIGYSVQTELEWLNEHMADIFTRKDLYVGPLHLARKMLTKQQRRRGYLQNPRKTSRQDSSYGKKAQSSGGACCKSRGFELGF